MTIFSASWKYQEDKPILRLILIFSLHKGKHRQTNIKILGRQLPNETSI